MASGELGALLDTCLPPGRDGSVRVLVSLIDAFKNNRPSRKPQLWEHFPLAVRRRVTLEVGQRVDPTWLDRPRVVKLAELNFGDGGPALQMELVTRDGMNMALYKYGVFEISETTLVLAFLRPGMTVLDVGANIGYYSLVAARAVGRGGVVHGFEPNDEIRSRAQKNLALNELTNVQLHAEAISTTSGEVRFYASAVPENTGISSIIANRGLDPTGKVVPAVSLDDFTKRIGRKADLLKMDIEGAELPAIEGGRELLGGKDAPALLFESFRVGPLLEALRGLGYSVRKLHYTMASGLELRDPEDSFESIFARYESPNFFAVKDPAQFEFMLQRANEKRSPVLRLLGQL
jgi:FkbM family methyltransferase